MTDDLRLFALNASRAFGAQIADHLGLDLSAHEERDFEEGEHKARSLVSVRGADVYVIQSLHGEPGCSVNDKLCRLLFFVGALRDAAAARITVVAPYLCYARKDRRTQPRDPVTTRYVASLFEAVGVDCVMTIDVHNPAAFQNAFRCRTENLEARRLFVERIAARYAAGNLVVLSPDSGGVKRAEAFCRSLTARLKCTVDIGFMEKYRIKGEVFGQRLCAEVSGRAVVIVDDMIGTGTTVQRAAAACRQAGATTVIAAATHGLFAGDAPLLFATDVISHVFVTDAVPPFRLPPQVIEASLTVLPIAPLFGDAIKAMSSGGSVIELLAD